MGVRTDKARAVVVATARENAGTVNRMVDSLIDHWVEGDDLNTAWEKVQDEVVQEVSERYSARIARALRRAGLQVADDDVLTPDRVRELISEQAGIDLQELSVEGVLEGIDHLASAKLSAAVGMPIDTMLTAEGFKQAIGAAVMEALRNGTAEAIIGDLLVKRARKAAQWKRENVTDPADQKRLEHRARQHKYAAKHSQMWVPK